MNRGEEDDDKSHEPTPKRIEDARREGRIARSMDLVGAAAMAGLALAAASLGAGILTESATTLRGFLAASGGSGMITGEDGGQALRDALRIGLGPLAPLFLLPVVLALTSILAQRALVLVPANLPPKLSRLSPLANAKKKFGRDGLFEFLKSFMKLLIFSGLLGALFLGKLPDLVVLMDLPPGLGVTYMLGALMDLTWQIVLIALAIAAVDYLWMRASHLRQLRMSRQELVDEMKESDGDPAMKQARRSKGQKLAQQNIGSAVPQADVIIVNPTHYAVALGWSRKKGEAPVCLAKGVDETARRIREIAQQHGIPMHSDPPTARALFATIEIGQQIAPDQYAPVAAAIRFAEDMRKKARTWR